MNLSLFFWVVYLIVLIVGFWQAQWSVKAYVPNLIILILIGILGWSVFGAAIHR